MRHRVVQPELLDSLPPDAPEAVASRRDLRRINQLMGNGRLIGREMLRRGHAAGVSKSQGPPTIAELGAGDGTMLLKILQSQAWEGQAGSVVLVDRQPVVASATLDGFKRLGWAVDVVEADVFTWLRNTPITDMMVTNLFLHHFEDPVLGELFMLAGAKTRCLVACEPRRSSPALLGSRLLGLIGCNRVTRHDAVASVRAGFRETELGDLFRSETAFDWTIRETVAGPFSHLFSATR